MNKLLRIASHSAPTLILVLGTMSVPALAAELSSYRSFQFGTDLAAVTGQAGPTKPEVKVIHSRPALIQEIEWSPQPLGSSPREESVQQVVFRFYDGKLFGIAVKYDQYKTEGMTVSDVIEAISTMYGPPETIALPTKSAHEGYDDEVVAVWQDPDYRFDLVRTAYGSSFKLIGVSKRLQAAAQAAATEAKRLDDKEAPQREAARIANNKELEQAKLDKSRLVNKPKFRP
jgi:hypothetical protein